METIKDVGIYLQHFKMKTIICARLNDSIIDVRIAALSKLYSYA